MSRLTSQAVTVIDYGIGNLRTPGLDFNGVGLPEIPHLADGGIVDRPTRALIGEAGPEAVIPLTGLNAARAGIGVSPQLLAAVERSNALLERVVASNDALVAENRQLREQAKAHTDQSWRWDASKALAR